MRLSLVILLILHNLPLKNANSIYEFSLPKMKMEMNHTVQIWDETGDLDLIRTDIRFLFYSSKFGFKNPHFIQNVFDSLMDNALSTVTRIFFPEFSKIFVSNLITDATEEILENSENLSNFSEKPTLWIIDFQSLDYAKIFPQFDVRDLSCDEFDFYGKNRYFGNFDLLLLETNSECGLNIHKEISKNSDFILQSLASKWKFYDIILLETAETTNYTYSPYPEYREELLNLKNMKKQRYFQNAYLDKLYEMCRTWSDNSYSIEMTLMIRLSARWGLREDIHRFNVFYALRKLFYFWISKQPFPESPKYFHLFFYVIHIFTFLPIRRNWINVVRQLMILEFIYIVAKYTVDDTRSVIWPYILVNEIIDLFGVFKYRTTEYLPFKLQLVKILQTCGYFMLLNQYPDFYILIWLLLIFALQLFSFFLYSLFPPLTWTVPILDIAPTEVPKNQYMIYTRYAAIVFVLSIFWVFCGGIELKTVMVAFFSVAAVGYFIKAFYILLY
ncbi:hypothetical protein B9Z55_021451 [Caenorhabditis nigoni]|uniref:Uncharacterized protein n=1 Tax=Caenorhabditis nigoni TaxID=1611254 RepID=A0A2G5TSL9_9PELO|nr:hypothetical protein B9Z55_021451 [Caenorhabditis nigoni]